MAHRGKAGSVWATVLSIQGLCRYLDAAMSGRFPGLVRRLRYGPPIVVVSGLPRSGTSMAMKMLEAGGLAVVTDNVRAADDDNPRGYYEDERVKDLARDANRAWLRDARGKAIKIISFLLKDLPPDNNYKVLFMERDLGEVLASQQKMLDHRGERLLDRGPADARALPRAPAPREVHGRLPPPLRHPLRLLPRRARPAARGVAPHQPVPRRRRPTKRRWSRWSTAPSIATAPEITGAAIRAFPRPRRAAGGVLFFSIVRCQHTV